MKPLKLFAFPAVIGLALSGCGDGSSDMFPQEDGSGSGATVNADGTQAQSKTTIETADGKTIVQETGADLPVELPEGLSLYPGAKVIANTRTGSEDGNQTTIMFESKATPKEIIDHYKGEAKSAGMDISIDLSFEDNSTIGADRAADGMKLTVSGSREEDAELSTVMLNVIRGSSN